MRLPTLRGLFDSNVLLGMVAVLAGGAAAWMAARELEQRTARLEQEARQRYATAPFVVASRDLPKGQRIDASLLSIRKMPKVFAPTDAVPPDAAGMLVGGRTAVDIRRGTPVVPASLIAETGTGKLSEQLPEGMRAVTIQVDPLNAMSGHLRAGDLVDICFSRNRGSATVMVPLLQRVRVLATGSSTESQAISAEPEQQTVDFSAVTLLLSAVDAQRVVLAEQAGRLTLLLRRAADDGFMPPRLLDSSELLAPVRAARQIPRSSFGVELLTGGTGGIPARSWLSPGEGA